MKIYVVTFAHCALYTYLVKDPKQGNGATHIGKVFSHKLKQSKQLPIVIFKVN